jgi:predicted dehydrogenase
MSYQLNQLMKVGIIGCGLIGNKRARVIRGDPLSSLCCAADPVISNAESLLRDFGDGNGRVYQHGQEMLAREKMDAVIVATPNKYLKEISLTAIRRGFHVLCEKPLGRNLRESVEMVVAAKKNNVFLKTGFNHRHHPAIWKAHELYTQGAIGPLMFIRAIYGHGGRPGYEREWRARREISGGGELLDQGVHVVDLFRWFLGDFEEAFGTISTYYWDMGVEDNAFALFKTEKGQTASMHTSWTQWKNRFVFEVFGEAGYLIIDGLGGSYGTETLKIGKRRKSEGSTGNGEPSAMSHQLSCRYAGGPPEEEVIEFTGSDISWQEEWKEFINAIKENREPFGNGLDGLEANRMIEAVYRSTQENRPVKIHE